MSIDELLAAEDILELANTASTASLGRAIVQLRDDERLLLVLNSLYLRRPLRVIPWLCEAARHSTLAKSVEKLTDMLGSLGLSAGERLRGLASSCLNDLLVEWEHPSTQVWDMPLINTIESAVELGGEGSIELAMRRLPTLTPTGRDRLIAIGEFSPALREVADRMRDHRASP